MYKDANCDTNRTGDAGLAGVQVVLTYEEPALPGLPFTKTVTTDANGDYAFTGLRPDLTYSVQVMVPNGYTASAAIGADGVKQVGSSTLVVPITGANPVSQPNDFPVCLCECPLPVTICGAIYLDANCDGILDSSEEGKTGVTVQLFNTSGVKVAETTTDLNGGYCFVNVPNAVYSVRYVVPSGFVAKAVLPGQGGTIDSAFPLTGIKVSATTGGQAYLYNNFLVCMAVTPPPPPAGNGGTRTQGYYKNHQPARQAALAKCGSFDLGAGVIVTNDCQAYDILWANVAQTSTGADRSALGQARIKLAYQLLTAEFNACLFGAGADTLTLIAQAKAAMGTTDITRINSLQAQLDAYNNSGDNIAFPGGVTYANKKGRGCRPNYADATGVFK